MLLQAIRNNEFEKVNELLHVCDPSLNDNEAIRLAATLGKTNTVERLLKDPRVNPADMNNYAIRWTAEYGHTNTVATLMKDTRVNPADLDNLAIRWAARNGHTDTVKVLIKDNRVDPKIAIIHANETVAKQFIQSKKHGYNIHKKFYEQYQLATLQWFLQHKQKRKKSLKAIEWTLHKCECSDMFYELKKFIKLHKFE